MSGWETVACCDDCWWGTDPSFIPNDRGVTQEGIRMPFRVRQEMRVEVFCHFCGWSTYSGIYVRVDTRDEPAAMPRIRKEV